MKKMMKWFSVTGFVALSAMLAFGANGMAYVDPSVMTYMIQLIAGIVVAIGAVVGIYFRRAKKKINQTLNIDENRNKEVESDEIESEQNDSNG